jgi:peptidyl-prolyl cis-trans isomerase SurA
MMKRLFVLCIMGGLAVHLCAQQDDVLLRIDQEEITRSAFETAYRKSGLWTVNEEREPIDFLLRFIGDRLKIIEAKAKGLDAAPEFRQKVREYGDSLRMDFFIAKNEVAGLPDESQSSTPTKRVLVMQVFRAIPQNCTNLELEKTNRLMNWLYNQLRADPKADFAAYVKAYSEDKACSEIGRLETPVEFEQTVFSMQKGEVSAPFFTPLGMHLVKVLDVKEDLPGKEEDKIARLRMNRKYKAGVEASFLQQLKKAHRYVPNPDGINELLASGKTDKTLFTLHGSAYSGHDFHDFAETNPKGIQRQWDDFVLKSLMDCENRQQEVNVPDYAQQIAAYENALLLSEITRQEVTGKAQTDKAGLSAYFSLHRNDYRWAHPRFKGIILHTRDKSIIAATKKLVKKRPMDEWQKLIAKTFNPGIITQVQVEQGLYQEGDNAYVDHRVFGKRRAAPLPSYPFTVVIGKKIKAPESYHDAPLSLLSDYEKFLEQCWMRRLYQTYKVEINEEVLKTVKNH